VLLLQVQDALLLQRNHEAAAEAQVLHMLPVLLQRSQEEEEPWVPGAHDHAERKVALNPKP
jgi:hypothetical protein